MIYTTDTVLSWLERLGYGYSDGSGYGGGSGSGYGSGRQELRRRKS